MVVILFGIFIFTCVYVKNYFKNTRDIGREDLEIITLDFDQIIETLVNSINNNTP